MNQDFDFSKPLETDVVIAGAGLPGLVTGAILAKKGHRVTVVDHAPVVGGRFGSVQFRDYWLDFGHRDGRGIGDVQVGWSYGQLAAKEADVHVPLKIVDRVVRIHHLHEGTAKGGHTVTPGRWGEEGFIDLATKAFGCADEHLQELMITMMKLARSPVEMHKEMMDVNLRDWLNTEVEEEDARLAVLTMLRVIYSQYPERASVGRVMGFFYENPDLPDPQPAFGAHPTAGGMQGLVQPFADAIKERGGQILLDMQPLEVLYEGDRAVGLLAVNHVHLAVEIRAKAVVLSYPLWEAAPLIGKAHMDPGWAELSDKLEDVSAEGSCWVAGLKEAPRVRTTGEVDDHIGWNRLLTGPGRAYHGGYHVPTLAVPDMAPDGKHLIHVLLGRWVDKSESVPWQDFKGQMSMMRDYLHEFYSNLGDSTEWSGFQRVSRPAFLAWAWSGIERHAPRAPNVKGLYVGGTTVERDGRSLDIAPHVGMLTAQAVQEDLAGSK